MSGKYKTIRYWTDGNFLEPGFYRESNNGDNSKDPIFVFKAGNQYFAIIYERGVDPVGQFYSYWYWNGEEWDFEDLGKDRVYNDDLGNLLREKKKFKLRVRKARSKLGKLL